MNTAERIQKLRKTKGISQEKFAEELGVSRQAVSKWENGQSTPDIEKIVAISNYFSVTTDYLLKGIDVVKEEKEDVHKLERKLDARIFTIIATMINFIGLAVAIMIWNERRTPSSVAVGFILMTLGCAVFVVGLCVGEHKDTSRKWFGIINVWVLLLMPISCAFNFIDARGFGGGWWTFSPVPRMVYSLRSFYIVWFIYIAICLVIDGAILSSARKDCDNAKMSGNL